MRIKIPWGNQHDKSLNSENSTNRNWSFGQDHLLPLLCGPVVMCTCPVAPTVVDGVQIGALTGWIAASSPSNCETLGFLTDFLWKPAPWAVCATVARLLGGTTRDWTPRASGTLHHPRPSHQFSPQERPRRADILKMFGPRAGPCSNLLKSFSSSI